MYLMYLFWILDHFLHQEKLKTLAKNEVKAVSVAVSAALRNMLTSPRQVLAAPRIVLAIVRGRLAAKDTNGNSRGLEGPSP